MYPFCYLKVLGVETLSLSFNEKHAHKFAVTSRLARETTGLKSPPNELLLCLSCDRLGGVVWLSSLFATLKFLIGAEGGTRTPTSYLTRPSNVRVCQFRHFGMK